MLHDARIVEVPFKEIQQFYPLLFRQYHFRSDNLPPEKAQAIRDWLKAIGVRTLYIEPGSPWENGYVESFNGKLRDELLQGEVLETLKEAQVLIE